MSAQMVIWKNNKAMAVINGRTDAFHAKPLIMQCVADAYRALRLRDLDERRGAAFRLNLNENALKLYNEILLIGSKPEHYITITV